MLMMPYRDFGCKPNVLNAGLDHPCTNRCPLDGENDDPPPRLSCVLCVSVVPSATSVLFILVRLFFRALVDGC